MNPSQKQIVIRNVWAANLQYELSMIQMILPQYPFASIDTEFPGVIFTSNVDKHFYSMLSPSDNYLLMKANVDALKMIQLGLTLADSKGNLPDLGTRTFRYVWQFNFQDFDVERDRSNPKSIMLLQEQGIDFFKNKKEGIPSWVFRMFILNSGLVFNRIPLTWITFHSCYDFGFLIKLLIGGELPPHLNDFRILMAQFFGPRVYDLKHMIKFCDGIYGGLEKVAKTLNVDRVVGKSHQAGSDSLLIFHTFMKLVEVYKEKLNPNNFQGVLFGLEEDFSRCV